MKIIYDSNKGYLVAMSDAEMAAVLGFDLADPAYDPPVDGDIVSPGSLLEQYQVIRGRAEQIRVLISDLHTVLQQFQP